MRQGLCSHKTQFRGATDFVPRFEALGIPHTEGLCNHQAHLWATADFVPRREALGNPQTAWIT